METKGKIEAHIEKLKEEIKSKSDYLLQLKNAVKTIKHDVKKTETTIAEINGAIQAYSDTVRLLGDNEDGNLIKQALEGEVIAN